MSKQSLWIKLEMYQFFYTQAMMEAFCYWKWLKFVGWKETNLPNIHMDICFSRLMVLCKLASVQKIWMLGRLVSTHPNLYTVSMVWKYENSHNGLFHQICTFVIKRSILFIFRIHKRRWLPRLPTSGSCVHWREVLPGTNVINAVIY